MMAVVMYDNNIVMSLAIVGSCSKVTQNIVLAAAKQGNYSKITISDLLPTYCFHQRFYKLKRQLADQKSTADVQIDKTTRLEQLQKQIEAHNHVLFVTHDYFHSTTSKTKLMELTANLAKNVLQALFRSRDWSLPHPLSTITMVLPILSSITWKARRKYAA